METLHRRHFLDRALRGGLALTAGPVALVAATARAGCRSLRWPLKLSGSSINFSRLPLEQACERIARLGFEAIDLWSAHAGCPHLDDAQARLGPDGLRTILAQHGLRLNAFSVYAGGYAKYAELLGGVGGGLAIRGSTGPCPPSELSARMREFLESLRPELELAERHDATLVLENHGNALLDSIDSLKAFVDQNRSPRLGLALAPFHIQARGESVEDAIRAAGPCLRFFYAWQYDPAMGLEQLPGFGPADAAPWLAALARVPYTGYVNPFLHEEPSPEQAFTALARSRDYLRARYEAAVPA